LAVTDALVIQIVEATILITAAPSTLPTVPTEVQRHLSICLGVQALHAGEWCMVMS